MKIQDLAEGARLVVDDLKYAGSIRGERRRARAELKGGLDDFAYLLENDICGGIRYGNLIPETVIPLIDPEGVYPLSSKDGRITSRLGMEKIFGKSGLEEVRKGASDALERYVRQCCDRNVRAINVNKEGAFENLPDEDKLKEYIDFCEAQDILPEGFYGGYQARIKDAKGQQKWLIEADRQEKELSERRCIEDRFIDLSERITYLSRMKPYVGHPSTDKPPEIGVLGRLFAVVSIGDAFGLKGLLAEKIYPSKIGLAYGVFGEALEEAAKYLSEHPEHTDVLGLVAARTFRDVMEATQPLVKYAEAYDSDCIVKDAFGQYTEMLGLFDLPLSREADILRELYNLAEADLTARMEKLTDEVERLVDEHAEVSRRRFDLRLSCGDTLCSTR
jgi:hypothetical protein